MFAPIRTVSESTPVLPSDYTVLVDATDGADTIITLRPAADCYNVAEGLGQVLLFKDVSDPPLENFNIVIVAVDGDTIDGAATVGISAGGQRMLQSDGVMWRKFVFI